MDISDLVYEYFTIRKLTRPNTNEAMLFLMSEIGELADMIVSSQKQWVRNNKDKENIEDYVGHIANEIGDVLMMLTVVANSYDLDPFECMSNKIANKLWEIRDET